MRHLFFTLALLLTASPSLAAIPPSRKADMVAIIPIRGPIDSITVASFRSRLAQAEAAGADAVVIELDTPGGELMATLELTNLIRSQAPANTIAWINPFAFSAGTILALSAREIITSPEATFGDAAPVTGLGPLPAAERAKIESPLLAEVTEAARRRTYDEKLVQAFVSVGIELWLLRDQKQGAVYIVDREEFQDIFGKAPDETLTSITPPPSDAPFEVHPLLTMMSEWQPSSDGPMDIDELQTRPPVRTQLSQEDAERLVPLGQVVSSDRLLTLKPWEAEAYGLSSGTVASDDELRLFLGAQHMLRIEPTWSESLVQLLMSWPVRAAFIALFVICMLVEMALPGTGWFGLGALAALVVLLGTPMLIGLASWWDVAAVAIGLVLIAVEILFIPGTIIAGMTGAVLLLMGLVGAVVSGDMASSEGQTQAIQGGLVVLIGTAVGWALGWQILKRLERTGRRGSSLILDAAVGEDIPLDATHRRGETAIAVTDLRPSGRIELHGETIDAVCSGRWIEAGTMVRITRDGLVVEVEPCS